MIVLLGTKYDFMQHVLEWAPVHQIEGRGAKKQILK